MIKDESFKAKNRFFEGLYSLDSIVEDDDLYEDNLVSTLLTKIKDPAIRNPRTLPKLTRARTAATSSVRPVSSSRAAVSRTLSLPAQTLHPSTIPNKPMPTLSTSIVVAPPAQHEASHSPRLLAPSKFVATPSRTAATAAYSSLPLPDVPSVHTPTPTAPPESSRMSIAGSGGSTKRKRSSKAASQLTARGSQLIFSNLVFCR